MDEYLMPEEYEEWDADMEEYRAETKALNPPRRCILPNPECRVCGACTGYFDEEEE